MRAQGSYLLLALLISLAAVAQEPTTITVSLTPVDTTLISQAKSLPPPPLTIVLDDAASGSAQQTFDMAGVDAGAMASGAASVYDVAKVAPDLDKLAKASAASGKKSRSDLENLPKKLLDKRKQMMDEKIKSKTWSVEDRNSKIKDIEYEMSKVKSLPLIGFNGLYPNTKLVPELAGSKMYTTCSEIQAYGDRLDAKRKEHASANSTDLYEIQKTIKERETMFATADSYVKAYADSIASMMPAP